MQASTTSHRRRRPRTVTLLLAALPLGLLGSGALVWQASYAAFSSTTVN